MYLAMSSVMLVGLSRDTVLSPAIDILPLVVTGCSWVTAGELECLGAWLVGGVPCPGEDEDWVNGEVTGTDTLFGPMYYTYIQYTHHNYAGGGHYYTRYTSIWCRGQMWSKGQGGTLMVVKGSRAQNI